MNRERALINDWYPVRLAPPTYPVTVGVWEADDITTRSHWRVFGARDGTRTSFGQHIVGWRPLPRVYRA